MKIISISFIIPAYNCEKTLREAVESIIETNLSDGDEIVICNDASTDQTMQLIEALKTKHSFIRSVTHLENKGGAVARNTAIENARHDLIFCLDSDNILSPKSVPDLRNFLLSSNADVASFEQLHYFVDDINNITHRWIFPKGPIIFADVLCSYVIPPASGNYLFTRQSWKNAGKYPEFASALDAWGFGVRQIATGSKMVVQPNTFYFHRHGIDSYYVRESKQKKMSHIAYQIIEPYINLIEKKDLDRFKSETWFDEIPNNPIHVQGQTGSKGSIVYLNNNSIYKRFYNKIIKLVKGS